MLLWYCYFYLLQDVRFSVRTGKRWEEIGKETLILGRTAQASLRIQIQKKPNVFTVSVFCSHSECFGRSGHVICQLIFRLEQPND